MMKPATLLITALTFLNSPFAAAEIGRVDAVHIAENYVKSGLVKDTYGRSIATEFVTFSRAVQIGKVYSIELETGADHTYLGGYFTKCTGSVEVYAADGAVLSSSFTCIETE